MLHRRDEYVKALIAELRDRQAYLPERRINSIYLGGGTPSLLQADSISMILQEIQRLFQVQDEAEITLEANPCDLTTNYLQQIATIGINRLSIGIQSFNNRLLTLIGRRHNATEALRAVVLAKQAGFSNISIDLIYGLPTQTAAEWKSELQQALDLNIQHISTYCLSYEEGTFMKQMLQNGEIEAIDDDTENEMYALLVNTLTDNGFVQYEVSNFAKFGFYSRHNSAYWNSTPYLGLGASAHSFDGKSRQWNISDLDGYIQAANTHTLQPEKEILTEQDKYNEQIMLSLRTAKGLSLGTLNNDDRKYCLSKAEPFVRNGQLLLKQDRLTASLKGINILNIITEHLMK